MLSSFPWGTKLFQRLSNTLRFNQMLRARRSRRRSLPSCPFAVEVLEERRLLTITLVPNFGPPTVLWNRPGETVPGQTGNTPVLTAAGTEYALNGPLAVGNNPYA